MWSPVRYTRRTRKLAKCVVVVVVLTVLGMLLMSVLLPERHVVIYHQLDCPSRLPDTAGHWSLRRTCYTPDIQRIRHLAAVHTDSFQVR